MKHTLSQATAKYLGVPAPQIQTGDTRRQPYYFASMGLQFGVFGFIL